ncbi:MAG: YqgE/AlgH family protein [Gammaproteobacteria bacterium]|nr:YqgE/AlgH family protein [Gammaproteobacteria bacterium]
MSLQHYQPLSVTVHSRTARHIPVAFEIQAFIARTLHSMATLKFLTIDRLSFVISPCHETNMTHTEHLNLKRCGCILFGLLLMIISGYSTSFAGTTPQPQSPRKDEGVFLVATEQLHGSSFQQTVILLTHYSKHGATGLTINRPAGMALQQAFPDVRQLQQRTDPLFLGGPVSTNAIFVLLRTQRPEKTMHRIADDIYFSTGRNVFTRPLESATHTATRTYAGYAGWAAGQLQNEISRGDWIMVRTHPKIVFEENAENLWQRLSKRWAGKWI